MSCDASRTTRTRESVHSLFNPGGPGFGGTDFVTLADLFFDAEVLDAFDIVGFDPRGTGLSEPAIDCIDDYDHFFAGTDITPDDDAERQQIVDLAEEFAAACEANNADIIQFVGTNNAARDIDSIRRALGEEEISYLGFSYGGQLGAAWATLFPDTVRAAVFDGADDPNADELESAAAPGSPVSSTYCRRTSPSAAPNPAACSTTTATPRERSTS